MKSNFTASFIDMPVSPQCNLHLSYWVQCMETAFIELDEYSKSSWTVQRYATTSDYVERMMVLSSA